VLRPDDLPQVFYTYAGSKSMNIYKMAWSCHQAIL